jgi:hypothetical protein
VYASPHRKSKVKTPLTTPPNNSQHPHLDESSPGSLGSPELSSTREEIKQGEGEVDEPFPSPEPAQEEAEVIILESPETLRAEGVQNVIDGLEQGNMELASQGVSLIALAVCVKMFLIF